MNTQEDSLRYKKPALRNLWSFFLKKKQRVVNRPPSASQMPFTFGAPAMIWQVLFFYVPLVLMAISSFVRVAESGEITGVTFEHMTFFLRPLYLKVISSSFLLAISNTLICFAIAYPLAYFIAFTAKRFSNLFLILIIVPFWTNFLLHVYAWFFVLDKDGFLNTLLQGIGLMQNPVSHLNNPIAIIVMMVYYYLPFMVFPLYSSLERMDVRLIEASRDLGATWFQTFRRIILPLTKRGLKAGFFLVYIPSFGEFAIPELMGGDKQMFVGTVIADYILGEETGALGSAFTLLAMTLMLISALAIYWLIERFIPGKSHA